MKTRVSLKYFVSYCRHSYDTTKSIVLHNAIKTSESFNGTRKCLPVIGGHPLSKYLKLNGKVKFLPPN